MVEIIKDKTNEEDVIKSGSEKMQDQLNDIKLIERPEYNALSDKEKTDWIRYSPSLTSEAMLLTLNSVNEMIGIFNQLGPMISKLSPLTKGGMNLVNATGFMDLVEMIKIPVETAKSLQGLIETISSTPIVSIVAEPLKMIVGLIASLAGLVYAMIMNPCQMIAAYYQAIKAIDLTELKERMDTKTAPNLGLLTTELETINIPDEEIKEFIMTNVKSIVEMVNSMKEMLEQALAIEETMDALNEADKNTREVLKAINTMGLSWVAPGLKELLDTMEVNFEEVKNSLDNSNEYKKNAQKFTNSANDFLNNLPQKYIKASDFELMKNYEIQVEVDKQYNDGKEDGYNEGSDEFEDFYEEFIEKNPGQDMTVEYKESKKTEILDKKIVEYAEEDDNWIAGYKEGFTKAIDNAYNNRLEYEKNKGKEDGSKRAQKDCVIECGGVKIDNYDNEAELNKKIGELLTKILNEEIVEETKNYKEGYKEGYVETFKNEVENLRKIDEKNGYEDGYKAGKEYMEFLCEQLTLDTFDEGTVTDQANQKLDTIKHNNKSLKYIIGYTIDENNEYPYGYTTGFVKGFNEHLEDRKKEDGEDGYNKGYKDGKSGCEKFLSIKSDAEILALTTTQINEQILTIDGSIDSAKYSSVYIGERTKGVDKGFKEVYNERLEEIYEKQGKSNGESDGRTKGINDCNTFNGEYYKTYPNESKDYLDRWYVKLTYFGNNHDDVKPSNSQIQELQKGHLKDKHPKYVEKYVEGYDIGYTKGYYDQLKALKDTNKS